MRFSDALPKFEKKHCFLRRDVISFAPFFGAEALQGDLFCYKKRGFFQGFAFVDHAFSAAVYCRLQGIRKALRRADLAFLLNKGEGTR